MFSELLNFRQRDRLPRFLRKHGWRGLGCRLDLQRSGLARIEPDEFANAANFHSDSAAIIECDLNHCVAAGWARPARVAFVIDRVQPNWVDRFGGESSAQQLQTDRAAVAFFTTPNDAVFGPDFG